MNEKAPMNIVGGLGYAVALQNPILTMIDIAAAWLHWNDLDFGSILILLPFSFVGLALGQWLDSKLTDSQSRLLVGVFLLIILGVQVMPKDIIEGSNKQQQQPKAQTKSADEEEDQALIDSESGKGSGLRRRTPSGELQDAAAEATSVSNIKSGNSTTTASATTDIPTKTNSATSTQTVVVDPKTKLIWAVIVGIVGGAATMLTNAMGPILNVYLLSVIKLKPTSYIGTRAMFFCVLNVGKLPMRFMAGTLGWKMLPLAGFLGCVSVVGVFGAKPIMLWMSKENFVKLELGVVVFSGLRL